MKALTVTAQPKAEEHWVHRFRNFGEDVYVKLRGLCEVNIDEIDAAFDQFHLRRIRERDISGVERAVAALNCEHHLDDSVFVAISHAPARHQTVGIVLDVTLGERIWEIAGRHPIWVIGSGVNRLAVEDLRGGNEQDKADVTIWSNEFELTTEQDWLGVLRTVDTHHGAFASDPPVNKLSVYGPIVTPPIVAALRRYGFEAVLPTASGFIALQQWRGLTTR
jgi:hypothetical protein